VSRHANTVEPTVETVGLAAIIRFG
jgi:hypothetical protein